jgi:SGT1 protein
LYLSYIVGELTDMITNFLEKESDYDGVDLNENVATLSSKLKVQEASDPVNFGDKSIKSTKIDFDADAFGATVKNLLDLVIPEDKWDSQSDMSDYENDDDLLAKNIDEIFKNRHLKGRKKKGGKETDIGKYMEQMDRELASTTIGKSFKTGENEKVSDNDGFDDIEDFTPVDVDMNAVKCMMESYKLEGSASGPTSNLLSSILNTNSKQTDV